MLEAFRTSFVSLMPTKRCPYCESPSRPQRSTCASRSCIAKHAHREKRAENAARDGIAARFAARTGEPAWARVPYFERKLGPADPDNLRAFRAELRKSIREAVRLVDEPMDFGNEPTPLVDVSCIACKGFCCELGKGHAFLDPVHMAMRMRERPGDSPATVYRDYVRRIPARAYRESCVYHGAKGCALPRHMRSLVCNAYECSAREAFARKVAVAPERTLVVAMNEDRICAAMIADPAKPPRRIKV